jgi:hypothetical protein
VLRPSRGRRLTRVPASAAMRLGVSASGSGSRAATAVGCQAFLRQLVVMKPSGVAACRQPNGPGSRSDKGPGEVAGHRPGNE